MSDISSFKKFQLLLWKNMTLQRAHKCQLVFELVLPVIFVSLLIIIRVTSQPVQLTEGRFTPLSLNTLELFNATKKGIPPLYALYYAPKSEHLEKLVGEAAKGLGLQHTGYEDNNALQKAALSANALAGIEFDGDWSKAMPDTLKFTLRFPHKLRTATSMFPNWFTGRLFSNNIEKVLRSPGSDSGDDPNYMTEGFLPIQNALSTAYIRMKANNEELPTIRVQRYPYPEHVEDIVFSVGQIVSLIILLSFVYPCCIIARNIVIEKEKQIKEVMKIMGLYNWIHWAAWFVKHFIVLSCSCVLIVILLKIPWRYNVALYQHSDFSVMFVFFLVYVISLITFCFMIAPFFSKASTAAAVMGLLWFITYLPCLIVLQNYDDMILSQKLGWCLLVNSAMTLVFRLTTTFEIKGEGMQWSNLFTPVNADDDLTIGAVIIVMLISSVICMIICLYIEQVFPGPFGVTRPWYFPVTRSFWCGHRKNSGSASDSPDMPPQNRPTFEAEPENVEAGVQIRNLQKKFGKRLAVKGIWLNMFMDEITVLLGHNGAGKTTTIAMLTGMFRPSKGTAIINGYDICHDMKGARKSVGICPQHNVLMDDMSVSNHLRFYSRLRGYKKDAVENEVKKYLELLGLTKKANVITKNLSGGMQRKVCLCCALCGGSKVVFCDEPSSGLDPAARRQLWELLEKEKLGRTVLLTTHFMDEADFLGDRIAIMCDGELKCYGTSFFLKKHYGSGYTLICEKGDGCVVDDVTALLALYIPDIEVKDNIGSELSYTLADQYSDRFEKMLGALEDRSKELHLNGYGVGITSMEEVFMKVGAETNARPEEDRVAGGGLATKQEYPPRRDDDKEARPCKQYLTQSGNRATGMRLWRSQWRAMFLKKIVYTWRSKILFFVQNLLPVLIIVMTVLLSRKKAGQQASIPMTVGLSQYAHSVTTLGRPDSLPTLETGVAEQYEKFVTSFGSEHKFKTTQNFSDFILDQYNAQAHLSPRFVAAASLGDGQIIAWLNSDPLHAAPLSLNLVHNALARHLIDEGSTITVVNSPYHATESEEFATMGSVSHIGQQLAGNVCFAMCFVSSMYMLFLIYERESRAKLLQFVSGVRVPTFWMSIFVWDFVTLTFTCIVIIITVACLQPEGLSTFVELMRYFFILLVFVIAVLPYTYLLALLFHEPATGFLIITVLNIFVGCALAVVVLVLSAEALDTENVAIIISDIARVFPHFSLTLALSNCNILSLSEKFCGRITLPPTFMCELVPACCDPPGYFSYDEPGVMRELTYFIVTAILLFLLLLMIEYGVFKNILYMIRNRGLKDPPPLKNTNVDVRRERERILNMSEHELQTKNLVVDRMSKYYVNFLAVNQVSVCVEKAECFGLLGVNGAGKTTTFKMLTGDEKITYGSAYVQGLNLEHNLHEIYNRIGYCPQFDGLLYYQTGREVMRMFCLLRGVPAAHIKPLSERLAKALGFMRHLDKPTNVYSGGNKRKLSTAVAMIGGPAVVYLDEPTTGMDPAARRQLWNVVCAVRDSGKSIVLTSHSMEECEALCTRLAIMVNGEFQCMGSTQHLKNLYSKGLVLKLKVYCGRATLRISHMYVPQNTTLLSRSLHYRSSMLSVIHFVLSLCVFSDDNRGMLSYYIPLTDIKWSKIFGVIERNRYRLNIEDYSISQTSLEDIFLEFAQLQRSDTRVAE
ncbi:hypothetical protein KR093_009980 [Drosophila rubida]|uniref:ABC transporter domain-containing protein n=1 Tax=Drosophila rubida TaxID=30044 RepID=A0AAD4KBB9_9MUSC|nr:hypothetical protein KR093_009980 [Drosophila rubida]